MDPVAFWNSIVQFTAENITTIEYIGSALLLLNVYLLARENIWNYIPGAIGVIIFFLIFFSVQLYADALLQIAFYLPMQIAGWWLWMYGGPTRNNDLNIITLNNISRVTFALVTGTLAISLGYIMNTYTEAAFPYIDSLIAALSVVATLLMTRKILESWTMWIVVDLIAVPLYFVKELYVTSALYVVFGIIATYGLFNWYITWRDQGDFADDES